MEKGASASASDTDVRVGWRELRTALSFYLFRSSFRFLKSGIKVENDCWREARRTSLI
jgi:hypothetical protein